MTMIQRNRQTLGSALLAAVISLFALAPTSASAQSDELLAAAKKEGKVMIYGEMITPTMRSIKEGFEAKYPGITMEFIYYLTHYQHYHQKHVISSPSRTKK